jgi:hypothetical protein
LPKFVVHAIFVAVHHAVVFHHVNDFIGNSQVLDGASPHIAFRHSPEAITILSKKKEEFLRIMEQWSGKYMKTTKLNCIINKDLG